MTAATKPTTQELRQAIREHNAEHVKILLSQGVDQNEKDKSNETCLVHAVCRNSLELVKILLENEADIDAQDHNGQTALMHSVFEDIEILNLLVEKGAALGIKDHGGQTARGWAKSGLRPEAIKILTQAETAQAKFSASHAASTATQNLLLSRRPCSTIRARPTA